MPTKTLEATCPNDFAEHQARRDPQGLCWVFGDRTWTWAEAWEQSQRFAGALEAEGVTRGDRFAFIADSNPAILVAMQAAGLIGAADVVLDSRLAADEIAYILNDAQPRVLFVGHQQLATVEGVRHLLTSSPTIVVVGGTADELDGWIAAGDRVERRSDVSLDDACLVLYSSGTTGRPKGIVLTQRNLMAHTRNAFVDVEHGAGRRILLGTVMFHSLGLFAAATGTAGVVVPDLTVPSLNAALEAGVTHAFLSPTAIIRLQQDGPGTMRRFGQLEAVTFGCAPMPPRALAEALDAWPSTRFRHLYGMTEFVGTLTINDDAGRRDAARLRSVGRPIPGVELRVVDPDSGQDVAPGVRGELWFRSEQTTPGYLGRPEATAELITAGGWARTGDIGRVDPDGLVFVEDRMKDVVLVNGYSVFSSEVERVLSEHPSVVESAVIGIPHQLWGEEVKALVVLDPHQPVPSADLIAFAGERLAPHKMPSTIEVVASLPRTSSGKILKRELREPYWAGRERPI